jgi:hypothetical protein
MRFATCAVLVLAALPLAACSKEPPPAPNVLPPPEDTINLEYQELPYAPRDSYKLTTCIACDKEFATLGHPPMCIAYKNYEARVCDKKCLKLFAADPQGLILRKVNPKAMFDK